MSPLQFVKFPFGPVNKGWWMIRRGNERIRGMHSINNIGDLIERLYEKVLYYYNIVPGHILEDVSLNNIEERTALEYSVS
mmetsp:Transcript_29230/g.43123  ORF Transcript_29230/g.43123 Transcript_29230/m.43123 type:complete len:80 (+) Transcript_29230:1022-1261(+)